MIFPRRRRFSNSLGPSLQVALALVLLAGALISAPSVKSAFQGEDQAKPRRQSQPSAFHLPTQATSQEQDEQDVRNVLKSHDVVKVNPQQALGQIRESGKLSLATATGTLELELTPNDLRAPNYRAEEVGANGLTRLIDSAPAHTFKGQLKGRSNTTARFTIDENNIEGLIIVEDEKYFIESLRRFSKAANKNEFVIYRESDVIEKSPAACAFTLNGKLKEAAAGVSSQSLSALKSGASNSAIPLNREIELATEADYEFVNTLGSSSAANTEILTIMNLVEGVYENELGISFSIVYQHTWATPDDPYVSTNPGALLTEFKNHWNNNLTGVNRDVAHLWTGKDLDSNVIGVASIGVTCKSPTEAYGVSQHVFDLDIRVGITAHELGHNFGATHPDHESPAIDACAESVMQSHVGSSRSFCQFSRDQIAAYFNENSTCLTPTFSISGQITTGTADKSATLTITSATTTKTIEVGFQGNYVFRGLTEGIYTLSISRPFFTFTPASQTINILGADQTGVNFTGSLVGFQIGGRITEANGNPVSDVQVTLSTAADVVARTNTDASGNYVFEGVPATREYQVSPYKSVPSFPNDRMVSFTPVSRSIPGLSSNQTGIDFTAELPPPAPTPTPTPPPVTGLAGSITYEIKHMGTGDIYAINADGTNETNLTNEGHLYETPAWSPDGSKIAFTRGFSLYVMNADGNYRQTLIDNTPGLKKYPQWSPDGKKITYNQDDSVFVINADGSLPTKLANGVEAHWSPDGTKIVYADSANLQQAQIWTMNPDGSNKRQMTNLPGGNHKPKWSPDGSRILFYSERSFSLSELYTINSNGHDLTRLTTGHFDTDPTWSPDGSKIAFSRYSGGVYIMDAAGGSNLSRIGGLRANRSPSWKAAPLSAPVFTLLTEKTSTRALAVDATTMLSEPFPLLNPLNFGTDKRTRITLLALNLRLLAGETHTAVTAQAEDAHHNIYPLTVENIATVPTFNWLKQVTVILPTTVGASGDLTISIALRGTVSNKVPVKIK